MFNNMQNIEELDVSSNKLTTFELWIIRIKNSINYSNNRVTHFTNNYDVDLSNYQSGITEKIIFDDNLVKIDFDDRIFGMYYRCKEIGSDVPKIIMKTIEQIHKTNRYLLNWNCSCKQYYLQEYIVSNNPGNVSSTWFCDSDSNNAYSQECNNQSKFDCTNNRFEPYEVGFDLKIILFQE